MDNLLSGINTFYTNLFWPQLTNFTNWFTSNPVGQIILAIAILTVSISLIIMIITMNKKKGDD